MEPSDTNREDECDIPFKIENFTAMANFQTTIDLREVFANIVNAKMRVQNLSVQFDMPDPHVQVTLYQSGACTVIGCDNLQDVKRSFGEICKILKKIGQPHELKQFSVF